MGWRRGGRSPKGVDEDIDSPRVEVVDHDDLASQETFRERTSARRNNEEAREARENRRRYYYSRAVSCCPCPYGPIIFLPMLFIMAATMCTYYAAFECTFFRVKGVSKHAMTVTYGLFSTEDYYNYKIRTQEVDVGAVHIGTANSCSPWGKHPELTEDDLDDNLSFARTAIAVACALGGLATVWIWSASRFVYWNCCIYLMMIVVVLASIFTALSFYALQSKWCVTEEDCELYFAGYIGICAAILWFLSTCTIYVLRNKNPSESEKRRGEGIRKRLRRRRRKNRDEGDGITKSGGAQDLDENGQLYHDNVAPEYDDDGVFHEGEYGDAGYHDDVGYDDVGGYRDDAGYHDDAGYRDDARYDDDAGYRDKDDQHVDFDTTQPYYEDERAFEDDDNRLGFQDEEPNKRDGRFT